MNAFARHFDSSQFDFGKNGFKREEDPSRPIFYTKKVLNQKTNQLEEVEMIKITAPGETLCVYGGKVRDVDRMRWPDEYERFKKGEQGLTGIPLSKWPECANDIDFIDQMRANRINTVEDMANMSDTALRLFHGALEWRVKAQAFLAEKQRERKIAAQEDAAMATQAELEELRRQIAELKAAQAPKNKGGRPRKNPVEEAAA